MLKTPAFCSPFSPAIVPSFSSVYMCSAPSDAGSRTCGVIASLPGTDAAGLPPQPGPAAPPPNSSVTSSSDRSWFGSAWWEIDTCGSRIRSRSTGFFGSVTSMTSLKLIDAAYANDLPSGRWSTIRSWCESCPP